MKEWKTLLSSFCLVFHSPFTSISSFPPHFFTSSSFFYSLLWVPKAFQLFFAATREKWRRSLFSFVLNDYDWCSGAYGAVPCPHCFLSLLLPFPELPTYLLVSFSFLFCANNPCMRSSVTFYLFVQSRHSFLLSYVRIL